MDGVGAAIDVERSIAVGASVEKGVAVGAVEVGDPSRLARLGRGWGVFNSGRPILMMKCTASKVTENSTMTDIMVSGAAYLYIGVNHSSPPPAKTVNVVSGHSGDWRLSDG
jgi:hypothetical protein